MIQPKWTNFTRIRWPFDFSIALLKLDFNIHLAAGELHFLEHLLLSAQSELLQELYDSGGNYNAFSSEQDIQFFFLAPSVQLDALDEFLAPSRRDTSLEQNWEKEKNVILGEIHRFQEEKPSQLLGTAQTLSQCNIESLWRLLGQAKRSALIFSPEGTGSTPSYEEMVRKYAGIVLDLFYHQDKEAPRAEDLKDQKIRTRVINDLEYYCEDPLHLVQLGLRGAL